MFPIAKNQIITGYAYQFSNIQWAIFAILTWDNLGRTRDNEFSENERATDFHHLMDYTCSRLGLRRRNLGIYHQTEWGSEKRGHYHVLIAREGTEKVSPNAIATTMQNFWRPFGLSKIEPFNPARQLQGVAYQTKTEFDGNRHPRIQYEVLSDKLAVMIRRPSPSDRIAA